MRRRRLPSHRDPPPGERDKETMLPSWNDNSSAEDADPREEDSSEYSGSDDGGDFGAGVAGYGTKRQRTQHRLSSPSLSPLHAASSADKQLARAYEQLILQCPNSSSSSSSSSFFSFFSSSSTSTPPCVRRWCCCGGGGGFTLICVCLVGTAVMTVAVLVHALQRGPTPFSTYLTSSILHSEYTNTRRQLIGRPQSWEMPDTVNWTYVAESYSLESEGLGINYRWAQATGLHYAEYESAGGACYALPAARFGHSMVGFGANANGFVGTSTSSSSPPPSPSSSSSSSSQNSFVVAFGGISGFGPARCQRARARRHLDLLERGSKHDVSGRH